MLNHLILTEEATIRDALEKIDQSAISMVVVCRDQQVVGVLTDGDVRRGLLAGADLQTSVKDYITRDFTSVDPSTGRADILELMQARVLRQVPIVDASGRLKGVHTLHSILGREEKPHRAVIMAGGRGSRLGSLTKDVPKPMLKVAGRPILERLILHLVGSGITNISIAVNYLGEIVEDYFQNGSKWGCRIDYLRETKPLGTGGALSLLPDKSLHTTIVMNGDLLLETNLSRMLDCHEREGFYASMGTHHYSHEIPFGCINAEAGRITHVEEKPLISRKINGGVYLLSPEAIAQVPENQFYQITDLFVEALELGKPCGAYDLDGDWLDIGERDQLERARKGGGAFYS